MDHFLSPEQEGVFEAIKTGRNVLVTGSAGTGKSFLLNCMRELFSRENELFVCASTGIAAVAVSGLTIHSWAGIGLGSKTPEEYFEEQTERRGKVYRRIRYAKRLAIDEISMIHGELFNLINRLFQLIRGDDRPFGGIQLIMFGDFLQLPPVSSNKKQQFCFQSTAWASANPKVFLLTQVFRQADAVFSECLNAIRIGDTRPEVLSILKSRYRAVDPDPSLEPVTVFTHNEDVEALNEKRLRLIEGEETTFISQDWGEPGPLAQIQKNCLAPATLVLKVGAQVMLLWNIDAIGGLANGSIGTVESIGKHTGYPVVKFRNGRTKDIEPVTWKIESGGDVLASRKQIPLRLAWAITAHKSQGMTLDKIKVSLHRAFEYGQAYVALSRARTLEGLFIESTAQGCIKAHPDAVAFYRDNLRA